MVGKLDIKDRKLLYELDLNSRRTLKEIGKKIGLSKNSVLYRIENLKKQGIIKNFHAILDVGKLGYSSYRLYLNLQGVNKEKEQDLIEYLKKQKIVSWLVSVDGDYDLAMLLLVKNSKELSDFWSGLIDKYGNYIEKRSLGLMYSSKSYSKDYLLDGKNNRIEMKFISESEEKILVDETDLKILSLLAPNADISILEISSKLKLNPKTVISRIKEMQMNKIILGYRVVLDLEKLGFEYYKVHFRLHNLTKQISEEINYFIKNNRNISYRNEAIGGDDLDLEIQVKNVSELRKLLEEMKERFGKVINDYKILHYYKEHKYVLIPTN